MNWENTRPAQESVSEPARPSVHHAVSQSALSDCAFSPIRAAGFLTRYDPSTVEERMKSIQSLLAQIYHDDSSPNSFKDMRIAYDGSLFSRHSLFQPHRLTSEMLQTFDQPQLIKEITVLMREIERANQRLVKMVRQRSYYKAKQATKCAIVSAILMANSSKTSADSKLRFSLKPPSTREGVEEWKRAMRVMARMPGGLPSLIRCKASFGRLLMRITKYNMIVKLSNTVLFMTKGGAPASGHLSHLWSALGDLYILSAGLDWDDIRSSTFSEKGSTRRQQNPLTNTQ
ncbi:hypothetical protein COOONC_24246, partial [Cooperia oncophora]